MSSIDTEINDINTGRMSKILYDHICDLLESQKEQALSELKIHYRSGTIDNLYVLSKVGYLCALDDLESNVQQKIKKGEYAIAKRSQK